MVEKKKKFVIYGKLIGKESKKSIAGFTVEALDKDLLIDDHLGATVTDKDGNFEILYEGEDFKEVFFDQKPDIYLRVKNPEGEIIFTTENKVKYEAARVEEFDIVISEKLIEKVKVENERLQFKHLTAVNPNYFGNITDEAIKAKYSVIFPMSNKTKYEELACVGLYPEDNLLEAIIEVKLPYGYKGSLCTRGSKEYVVFYIDYGDGFVRVGAAAEVNVHDLSFVDGRHLYYAVRKSFIPKDYLKCDNPQIVKVRAILSWEKLPTGPSYIPVWGNVVDSWVQIKPVTAYELKPIEMTKPLPKSEVTPPIGPIPPIEKIMIFGDKVEIKELIDKSFEAEKRIKEEGKVEEDRYGFKTLIMKNPNYFGSISKSKNKDEILKAVYSLPQKTVESLLPKLSINPDWLQIVKPMLYNTTYEELRCVGLYPENDLLEAVIEVKHPYGFNGDLCTLGSTQYVAFYIDYHDGAGFQHVATSTVGVHDIPDNDKHLFYAVKAPISNIASKLKKCTSENIVKVKAILSWNQDPSPFGHTYTPVWGNVLERDIQIRPKDGVKCNILNVNEVSTEEISQSGSDKGLAIKIDGSDNAVPSVFDRPFGGTIGCKGEINVAGADYYRFRYSDDNGISWKDITDKRIARHPYPWAPVIERTPDTDGWFSIKDYNTDETNYSYTALVHWNSRGKNGNYILRLELAKLDNLTKVKVPLPGQTSDVSIRLDNKDIEFFEFGGIPAPPLPAEAVVVKDSSGNYKKCDTFSADEEIKIFGNFRDDYFKEFSLKVFGGNIDVKGIEITEKDKCRYDSGIFGINGEGIIGAHNDGQGLEIGTLNLCTISQVKCAYGIELIVSDRAIVGYVKGYEFNTTCHVSHAYVTFDWDPKGCH